MKERMIAAAFLSALAFALPVSADTTTAGANANSGANAAAGAAANGNKLNASVGATATTSIKNSLSLTIPAGEPTKVPAVVPSPGTPSTPVPQIFGTLSAPADVSGIPMVVDYLRRGGCAPVATRSHRLHAVLGTGASGKTQVVFWPNQNYLGDREVTVTKDDSGSYETSYPDVERVAVRFPQGAARYDCLGILQVTAKEAGSGGFLVVMSDAQDYPFNNMRGFKDIVLVSVPNAVAAGLGVVNSGNGLSLGAGLVSMASTALSGGTGTIGLGVGSGETTPKATPGVTLLVLTPKEKGGIVVDPGEIQSTYFSAFKSEEGHDGKKYEAIKK